MLIFHHLDPSQNNVLNVKMSTFVAKFHSHQHGRTHIWHLSFFFPAGIVDVKMERQDNSYVSQSAIYVQLSVHLSGKKQTKPKQTQQLNKSGRQHNLRCIYYV